MYLGVISLFIDETQVFGGRVDRQRSRILLLTEGILILELYNFWFFQFVLEVDIKVYEFALK